MGGAVHEHNGHGPQAVPTAASEATSSSGGADAGCRLHMLLEGGNAPGCSLQMRWLQSCQGSMTHHVEAPYPVLMLRQPVPWSLH